jgi:hypothetical protein
MTLFGVDTSNNNFSSNDQATAFVAALPGEGFSWIEHKVSQGSDFKDAYWTAVKAAAAQNSLPCIGYHYVDTSDPAAQAQNFVNNGGGANVMLDVENGSGDIANFWAVVRAFNAAGVNVALAYIPHWYWQQIGSPDLSTLTANGIALIASNYPNGSTDYAWNLYVNDDGGDSGPGWNAYGGAPAQMWQFTSAAEVAGINVDANAFRGNLAQLTALLTGQLQPQPVKHVVITFNGTWGAGLVQYPSDVVNGLDQFVNPNLCVEVPCPYPATFGFIGGSTTDPSYQQSVGDAVDWFTGWAAANPTQTFALVGYSQGAEAASRVYMEKIKGTPLEDRFIGGITFGNPCRGKGCVAPGVADPGGHGISQTLMTELPTKNGQVVWADYVHSPANGDPGTDMYACALPPGDTVMGTVYGMATNAQLNDGIEFAQQMATGLQAVVTEALADPIGALSAAQQGIAFVAAPGGPTGPHISYIGEIGGYSNLVANAVGFLNTIATLTPARA